VTISSQADLAGLTRVGRLVAQALQAMRAAARPGLTTAELDEVGATFLRRHGARSAPQLAYGFPGFNCISVNEEIVHGVPGARVLRSRDVVKIDVTAELDGYIADAAVTVAVEPAPRRGHQLVACAKAAFQQAYMAARAGRPVNAIGYALEGEVRRHGFAVLRELHSHGVGRTIHEPPTIPQYFERRATEPLREGSVLTIEPIISVGKTRVVNGDDGWTLRTADGSLSAHYEHTVVITKGRPIIITAD
jgi:methionyl aminopeptidase